MIVGLLALVALGPSRFTVIVVIGVVFTPIIARTVRAAVLSERELDYVAAARLRNERAPYILFVEILPNVSAPILVEFTVRLGYAIFAIATLSFLGFGIQPSVAGLGTADLRELQPDQRGLLVDDAVPRARHREPRGRREPDLRRREPGVRTMSAVPQQRDGDAGARAPRAGRRLPRPRDRSPGAARGVPRGRARRVLRPGRGIGVRQDHGGLRRDALPAQQRTHHRGLGPVGRRRPVAHERRPGAAAPRQTPSRWSTRTPDRR